MSSWDLEDPRITRTRETGYPDEYKEPRVCECCGVNPIDEYYWEVDGLDVCDECMMASAVEAIQEDMAEAAMFIGAVRRDGDAVQT